MKINKTTSLLLALGMAAAIQTAQASLTYQDTLANLVANKGSLSIGDKTFSGFADNASGLTSFDATSIIVTASMGTDGTYYLTWGGNISLASSVAATADLKLNYIVTASAGYINMIDQSYTGQTQNGSLAITETVATGAFGGPVLATSQLTATLNSQTVGPNLIVNPAQTTLYVTKDIAFATFGTNSFDTISQVSQSFHQTAVPEPSTVVAGALLLLPFGVSTLRILRKSKVS